MNRPDLHSKILDRHNKGILRFLILTKYLINPSHFLSSWESNQVNVFLVSGSPRQILVNQFARGDPNRLYGFDSTTTLGPVAPKNKQLHLPIAFGRFYYLPFYNVVLQSNGIKSHRKNWEFEPQNLLMYRHRSQNKRSADGEKKGKWQQLLVWRRHDSILYLSDITVKRWFNSIKPECHCL